MLLVSSSCLCVLSLTREDVGLAPNATKAHSPHWVLSLLHGELQQWRLMLFCARDGTGLLRSFCFTFGLRVWDELFWIPFISVIQLQIPSSAWATTWQPSFLLIYWDNIGYYHYVNSTSGSSIVGSLPNSSFLLLPYTWPLLCTSPSPVPFPLW